MGHVETKERWRAYSEWQESAPESAILANGKMMSDCVARVNEIDQRAQRLPSASMV